MSASNQELAGSGGAHAPFRRAVKPQINLPWRKACEIACESLRIRFWRSLMTAAGIALGIAFLCFSLTNCFLLHPPGDGRLLSDYWDERNRQIWLVGMSLLVCLVGISNSMLMSVAERFRDIGTMKCLGALDKLVVRLFMIEALFLGGVASMAGWLFGLGAVLALRLADLGWNGAFAGLTGNVIFAVFGVCLGTGSLMTVCAALLPALRAAHLPPAAALRSDI